MKLTDLLKVGGICKAFETFSNDFFLTKHLGQNSMNECSFNKINMYWEIAEE